MRALVKLEQVLPAHLRRRVAALGSATHRRSPSRRPDRRPAAPDRDRRRLPRPRVPALRLPQPRRRPAAAARGRAALARQPRPPLVPRRLGPRPRGLAHVPRRPARRGPALDRRALHAARAARPRTPPPTSSRASPAAPSRYEARVTVHAPADGARPAPAASLGRRSSRSTTQRCEYRTARRQPRLAGDADRDARRRLRGARAAGAGRAAASARLTPEARSGLVDGEGQNRTARRARRVSRRRQSF